MGGSICGNQEEPPELGITMFEKRVLIDGKGHLLGRLASTVAKELLLGQNIVVVRCEELCITGPFQRNHLRYMAFLRKRTNTNPKRGPFHYRRPSKIFWRVVRGMLPHKTARGTAALKRLKVFEGIPPPFDKQKRMVVTTALKHNLRTDRKVTVLGQLSHQVGWGYRDVVEKLEKKRKIRSAAYYARKKQVNKLRAQARVTATEGLSQDKQDFLARFGHSAVALSRNNTR